MMMLLQLLQMACADIVQLLGISLESAHSKAMRRIFQNFWVPYLSKFASRSRLALTLNKHGCLRTAADEMLLKRGEERDVQE